MCAFHSRGSETAERLKTNDLKRIFDERAMKRIWFAGALLIPLLVATAQEALPPGFEHWSTLSLKQYEQKMHEDATTDPHHFAVELLADFPNDSAMLVRRESDGPPEWHETQIDVFFVQYGSATLLIGGKLINGETVGPHEKRNGTIQGRVRQKLSAGDVVRIPARVPHQVLLEGSHEFNYFVIKVKGYLKSGRSGSAIPARLDAINRKEVWKPACALSKVHLRYLP